MPVMAAVWPVTALYLGPVAVWGYRCLDPPGWVPESRLTSCDLPILVEQPTESVAPSDAVGPICRGLGKCS